MVLEDMSVPIKSSRPSLFMSPTSQPIENHGRVRKDFGGDVGKGAVAIVAVETVGTVEVVGDVDIGPTVVVVVPPGRRRGLCRCRRRRRLW